MVSSDLPYRSIPILQVFALSSPESVVFMLSYAALIVSLIVALSGHFARIALAVALILASWLFAVHTGYNAPIDSVQILYYKNNVLMLILFTLFISPKESLLPIRKVFDRDKNLVAPGYPIFMGMFTIASIYLGSAWSKMVLKSNGLLAGPCKPIFLNTSFLIIWRSTIFL